MCSCFNCRQVGRQALYSMDPGYLGCSTNKSEWKYNKQAIEQTQGTSKSKGGHVLS
jgi:hypothetical protein